MSNGINWWADKPAPKLFSYDPQTYAYTGECEADPSPLEPNVWLWPAACTDVAPPQIQEANRVLFYNPNQKTWESVVDYRGKTLYHKATKQELYVQTLGRFDDYTIQVPPADRPTLWSTKYKGWVTDVSAYKVAIVGTLLLAAKKFRSTYGAKVSVMTYDAISAKEVRARRALKDWDLNPGVLTPDMDVIQAEATARNQGESWFTLAEKQVTKATQLALVYGSVDGLLSIALATLDNANTEEAIGAVLNRFKQDVVAQLDSLVATF